MDMLDKAKAWILKITELGLLLVVEERGEPRLGFLTRGRERLADPGRQGARAALSTKTWTKMSSRPRSMRPLFTAVSKYDYRLAA